jgi:hypothetical protein
MPTLRWLLFCLLLTGFYPSAYGQTSNDTKAISDLLNNLFKGMQNGDSVMVRSTFAHEVTLATIAQRTGGKSNLTRENSIEDFIKAVGTPHNDIWYEEIWDLKIMIDGDFAQAWCNYAFYRGHTFSHCGVDAFQLIRDSGGWKIFHLADTRRSSDCEIPKQIQNKHKQ